MPLIELWDHAKMMLSCRCKTVQFLIIATCFVSIYTLVLMSLDRFLAVVYPIESMTWRTEAHCRLAIAVTWAATFVVCFPIAFANGQIEVPQGSLDDEHLSSNKYCTFLNNESIPFLPKSWEARWSLLAFQVGNVMQFI